MVKKKKWCIRLVTKSWIFFQNNTNLQTISLVSMVSKLFIKLTSQVQETRVWNIQIEFVRLDFRRSSSHKKQTQITKAEEQTQTTKAKKTNQRSNPSGDDEGFRRQQRWVCWCFSLDLWVGFLILVDDVSIWVFGFLDCWCFSLDFIGFVDGVLLPRCERQRELGEWKIVMFLFDSLDFIRFVVVDRMPLHLDSFGFARFSKRSSSTNLICIENRVQWTQFSTQKSILLHSRC